MKIFDEPIGYNAKLPKGTPLFYQIGSRKFKALVTLANTSDSWQTGYYVIMKEVLLDNMDNGSLLKTFRVGDKFLGGANELFFYEE